MKRVNKNSLVKKHFKHLRKYGIFNGDCHNHINWPTSTQRLQNYLNEISMDYIALCQGWLTNPKDSIGHDGNLLSKYITLLSNKSSQIRMGAEYPKTRFGHVCWWKFPVISDPFGVYENYHDSDYFKIAGISDKKFSSPADKIPFSNESPLWKVARWKKLGGINMVPHPTSWWRTNQNADLICTNIAVDFCLDLLTTRLYDTLVVMGYDAEQIFYQNFWFNLLNLGYKINGVAETDGNLDGKHKVGDIRTYAYCNTDKFDEEKFFYAIKNGHSFVSSGPAIFARTDDNKLPGSIILSNNEERKIHFTVISSPEENEYISMIVIYRDGKPVKIIDISAKKLRKFSSSYCFKAPDRDNFCWILIKAYGSKKPLKRAFVDVIGYCELCEKESHIEYTKLDKVAFINPFYFWGENFDPPKPIKSFLKIKLLDQNKKPLRGINAKIVDINFSEKIVTDSNGDIKLRNITPLAQITVEISQVEKRFFSVYLDYPPLKKYFENIYAGKWSLSNKNLQPGQVPWSVFNFNLLSELLKEMYWEIQI